MTLGSGGEGKSSVFSRFINQWNKAHAEGASAVIDLTVLAGSQPFQVCYYIMDQLKVNGVKLPISSTINDRLDAVDTMNGVASLIREFLGHRPALIFFDELSLAVSEQPGMRELVAQLAQDKEVSLLASITDFSGAVLRNPSLFDNLRRPLHGFQPFQMTPLTHEAYLDFFRTMTQGGHVTIDSDALELLYRYTGGYVGRTLRILSYSFRSHLSIEDIEDTYKHGKNLFPNTNLDREALNVMRRITTEFH